MFFAWKADKIDYIEARVVRNKAEIARTFDSVANLALAARAESRNGALEDSAVFRYEFAQQGQVRKGNLVLRYDMIAAPLIAARPVRTAFINPGVEFVRPLAGELVVHEVVLLWLDGMVLSTAAPKVPIVDGFPALRLR